MQDDRHSCLSVQHLDIGSGPRPLLRIDELRVAAGEICMVYGASGCGKTTLLRTIAGLIDPQHGSVRHDGRTGEELGWPRFRRRVSFVAQQPVLLEGTVDANLSHVFEYRSAEGSVFDADAAKAHLASVGLPSGVGDKRARSLSVGEQQRVCLVRAMLIDPAVLLLDEPTSALDPTTAERVHALLREFASERGLAILIATHQTDRARPWCDMELELKAPAEVPA